LKSDSQVPLCEDHLYRMIFSRAAMGFNGVVCLVYAAYEPVIINIAQGTYGEGLALWQSKDLTLQGGWDSTFTTQTSSTI